MPALMCRRCGGENIKMRGYIDKLTGGYKYIQYCTKCNLIGKKWCDTKEDARTSWNRGNGVEKYRRYKTGKINKNGKYYIAPCRKCKGFEISMWHRMNDGEPEYFQYCVSCGNKGKPKPEKHKARAIWNMANGIRIIKGK